MEGIKVVAIISDAASTGKYFYSSKKIKTLRKWVSYFSLQQK